LSSTDDFSNVEQLIVSVVDDFHQDSIKRNMRGRSGNAISSDRLNLVQ
jgi:hypothetical protein